MAFVGIAAGMAVDTSDFEAVPVGTFDLEVVLGVGAVAHTDLDTLMSLSHPRTPLLVDDGGDGGSSWTTGRVDEGWKRREWRMKSNGD